MKTYKVLIKKTDDNGRNEAFWHDISLLIVAPNFAIAEDKANRYLPSRGYIESITFYGEMTDRDSDVIKLKER